MSEIDYYLSVISHNNELYECAFNSDNVKSMLVRHELLSSIVKEGSYNNGQLFASIEKNLENDNLLVKVNLTYNDPLNVIKPITENINLTYTKQLNKDYYQQEICNLKKEVNELNTKIFHLKRVINDYRDQKIESYNLLNIDEFCRNLRIKMIIEIDNSLLRKCIIMENSVVLFEYMYPMGSCDPKIYIRPEFYKYIFGEKYDSFRKEQGFESDAVIKAKYLEKNFSYYGTIGEILKHYCKNYRIDFINLIKELVPQNNTKNSIFTIDMIVTLGQTHTTFVFDEKLPSDGKIKIHSITPNSEYLYEIIDE